MPGQQQRPRPRAEAGAAGGSSTLSALAMRPPPVGTTTSPVDGSSADRPTPGAPPDAGATSDGMPRQAVPILDGSVGSKGLVL